MSTIESIKILIRKMLSFRYMHSGNYTSWENAKQQCSGYDTNNILKKVEEAVIKVKRGEAVYERDSVLFNSIEYSWPLLSGLLWVAAQNKGKLKVLDFGGSLGSSYFQNKKFLDTLETVEWNIVEQENFVRTGQEKIQDEKLQFHFSINEAITQNGLPDVLLISCVLPYLDDPYLALNELKQYGIPYLFIDNTYFNYEEKDRICIQKVPPAIYEASYPCWFLNYEQVKENISTHYNIVNEYSNALFLYLDGRKIHYRGMIAKHKTL